MKVVFLKHVFKPSKQPSPQYLASRVSSATSGALITPTRSISVQISVFPLLMRRQVPLSRSCPPGYELGCFYQTWISDATCFHDTEIIHFYKMQVFTRLFYSLYLFFSAFTHWVFIDSPPTLQLFCLQDLLLLVSPPSDLPVTQELWSISCGLESLLILGPLDFCCVQAIKHCID